MSKLVANLHNDLSFCVKLIAEQVQLPKQDLGGHELRLHEAGIHPGQDTSPSLCVLFTPRTNLAQTVHQLAYYLELRRSPKTQWKSTQAHATHTKLHKDSWIKVRLERIQTTSSQIASAQQNVWQLPLARNILYCQMPDSYLALSVLKLVSQHLLVSNQFPLLSSSFHTFLLSFVVFTSEFTLTRVKMGKRRSLENVLFILGYCNSATWQLCRGGHVSYVHINSSF